MKVITTSAFLCALSLAGCDAEKYEAVSAADKNSDPELTAFIKKIKSELIFVEGGKFKMGDFGVEYFEEHLPLDGNEDSKPLHDVELTSYSISKYKTRNIEYEFYSRREGLSLGEAGSRRDPADWPGLYKDKNMPAHADWYEADKYCTWLAKVTHLPFSLATEAQWEYAARSRGKYYVVATDDGTWKEKNSKGVNFATDQDRRTWDAKKKIDLSGLTPMPVDRYPSNPLGVYDMAGNGFEWVKDWYDPEYYQHSPIKDPQGPSRPKFTNTYGKHSKVIRGIDISAPGRGLSIARFNQSPDNNGRMPLSHTIRCVVNSPKPVK